MRHVILTGHAKISEGIASAAELILGCKMMWFNAYIEGEEIFTERIKKAIKLFGPDDEVVILTDVLGGSVNNEMMSLLESPNIHLVCGMNLPLVMDIVLSDQEKDIREVIAEALQGGKDGMQYCNGLSATEELDDF